MLNKQNPPVMTDASSKDSLCQECGTLSNWCCETSPRCQDGSKCNQITNRCAPPPSSSPPIPCGGTDQACCKPEPPSSQPPCNKWFLECFHVEQKCFDVQALKQEERFRILVLIQENQYPPS